jgi:hypothetical protein
MRIEDIEGVNGLGWAATADLVPAGEIVDPGRRTLEGPIHRRPQVVDLVWPDQALGLDISPVPDTLHFWVDFARAVLADPTARAVADIFGAIHGAHQAGGMQDTLAAHMAAENRFLGNDLDWAQEAVQDVFQTRTLMDKGSNGGKGVVEGHLRVLP